MVNTAYSMVANSLQTSGGQILCYGITALAENAQEVIEDISTDCDFVRALVNNMNQFQVALVHFRDVVEDAISEKVS